MMNKKAMSDALAEKLDVTKTKGEELFEVFVEVLEDAIVNGGGADIYKFGKFEVTERAAREGRNPQTGEAMTIEATKALKFKASSVLKKAVKGE